MSSYDEILSQLSTIKEVLDKDKSDIRNICQELIRIISSNSQVTFDCYSQVLVLSESAHSKLMSIIKYGLPYQLKVKKIDDHTWMLYGKTLDEFMIIDELPDISYSPYLPRSNYERTEFLKIRSNR